MIRKNCVFQFYKTISGIVVVEMKITISKHLDVLDVNGFVEI